MEGPKIANGGRKHKCDRPPGALQGRLGMLYKLALLEYPVYEEGIRTSLLGHDAGKVLGSTEIPGHDHGQHVCCEYYIS